jgi:phosphohistidine swiveling domain-containing protein
MKDLQPSEYQRLFQIHADGVSFLAADVWNFYYRKLEALQIFAHGTWTSYLPNEVRDRCLEEGLQLFADEQVYAEYVSAFARYRESAHQILTQILEKEAVTREEVEKFFATVAEHFQFYSKTEFFYTDRVFQQLEETHDQQLQATIKQLESVKTVGREFLNQLMFGREALLQQLVHKLAAQLRVPEQLLARTSMSEFLSVYDGKGLDEAMLALRNDAFVIFSSRDAVHYSQGAEAESTAQRFLFPSGVEKTLKGKIANAGVITGVVKVIPANYYMDFSLLAEIFASMPDGSVLVAETTSPELMPACKKAVAIVTDQGGLLSHAAIVSREMGIPCIVGVGNATQVLKDGDLVEVDAHAGIVRKL